MGPGSRSSRQSRSLAGLVGPETKGRVVTARRITRADWRADEVGHRDRRDQVWVVAARDGARPRQLTDADADAKGIAWAPDGRWIAYAADPRPERGHAAQPVDLDGPGRRGRTAGAGPPGRLRGLAVVLARRAVAGLHRGRRRRSARRRATGAVRGAGRARAGHERAGRCGRGASRRQPASPAAAAALAPELDRPIGA